MSEFENSFVLGRRFRTCEIMRSVTFDPSVIALSLIAYPIFFSLLFFFPTVNLHTSTQDNTQTTRFEIRRKVFFLDSISENYRGSNTISCSMETKERVCVCADRVLPFKPGKSIKWCLRHPRAFKNREQRIRCRPTSARREHDCPTFILLARFPTQTVV